MRPCSRLRSGPTLIRYTSSKRRWLNDSLHSILGFIRVTAGDVTAMRIVLPYEVLHSDPQHARDVPQHHLAPSRTPFSIRAMYACDTLTASASAYSVTLR